MNTEDENNNETSIEHTSEIRSDNFVRGLKKKRIMQDKNESNTNTENYYNLEDKFFDSKNHIIMNTFLKEQNIHSEKKEYFKRRTIMITRKQGNFGFELQSYGLFNISTNHIEYIFYISNIYLNSAANSAGLRVGDVILAINGIGMEEFKDLNKIIKYVKEKKSIRLVVLSEDINKKISFQKRISAIQNKITEKLQEYNNLCREEEFILKNSAKKNDDIKLTDKFIAHYMKDSFDIDKNAYFRNSIISTSSNSTFPLSSCSTEEIYNYNCANSYEETEWIITRL